MIKLVDLVVIHHPHLMELEIQVEKLRDLHRVSQVVNVDLDMNRGQNTKVEGHFSTQGLPVCRKWTSVYLTVWHNKCCGSS